MGSREGLPLHSSQPLTPGSPCWLRGTPGRAPCPTAGVPHTRWAGTGGPSRGHAAHSLGRPCRCLSFRNTSQECSDAARPRGRAWRGQGVMREHVVASEQRRDDDKDTGSLCGAPPCSRTQTTETQHEPELRPTGLRSPRTSPQGAARWFPSAVGATPWSADTPSCRGASCAGEARLSRDRAVACVISPAGSGLRLSSRLQHEPRTRRCWPRSWAVCLGKAVLALRSPHPAQSCGGSDGGRPCRPARAAAKLISRLGG